MGKYYEQDQFPQNLMIDQNFDLKEENDKNYL